MLLALPACVSLSTGTTSPSAETSADASAPSTGSSSGRLPPELARRTLAFAGRDGIYVGRADGSSLRALTHGPAESNWPEWSPDGTKIVYSYRGGELWLMNADGSDARFLARGGEPSWSGDGRWIAFDCAPSSDPDGQICAMHPDGTGREPILDTRGSFPSWRP